MIIAKPKQASVDDRRATGFLLGLILVLSVLFVAFEYTSNGETFDDADEELADMAEDMEMLPALDTKDMISAAPMPMKKGTSEKIKAVDHAVDRSPSDLAQTSNPLLVGDGEGVKKEATVTEALPQTVVTSEEAPLNFRVVQQIPEFPGGIVELMKFLNSNLKYPEAARSQRIQGKVVVSFIINTDGSISGAKVDKSPHPLLAQEAMRVVRMMPRWKPGIENDKPCRTLFAIPINFVI